MAIVFPFSDLRAKFPAATAGASDRFCLADTNFVVSCLHEEHKFWSISKKFFNDAAQVGFSFFVTHTSRTEFLDIERKFALTRPIVELYREEGQWKGKIKVTTREAMDKSVARVVNSEEGFEYFSDKELKDMKKAFYAYSESGKVGWINFCQEFLSTRLGGAWDQICAEIGLNYLNIREEESSLGTAECLMNKKVNWEEMVALVGKTAMGTSDAMIANAFLSSKFQLLVTTDLDLAYGLCADLDDSKFVAVPDNMFTDNRVLFQKIGSRK